MQQSIEKWLQTIADPTVRHNAMLAIGVCGLSCNSLESAIWFIIDMDETPQGRQYWHDVYDVIKEHGNYPAPAPSEEGEVDKWVGLDRLPPPDNAAPSNGDFSEEVLITDGSCREIGYYNYQKSCWFDDLLATKIIAWQPLPSLPNPPIK